ncbi:MAG: type I-E CRISPR-associated protein Cas7/Cse4/CasC [Alphaproteobacteria bacterium]|nr:type I-E CRISPR-associated protein Cas7/Cse4/CasC [Alphaproteobacteria bacterium]
MTDFIQLHLLTSYPPANLNRDDTGRPKTARMGGAERLRVSSQSLKRAFRTSEIFRQQLDGTIGVRTRRVGPELFKKLVDGGMDEKIARKNVEAIAEQFGKLKTDKAAEPGEIEQLVHLSSEEQDALDKLAGRLLKGEKPPEEDLIVLTKAHKAVDIAMFGRMLADRPKFNREAAVQVAHAITTHRVTVEDDYFTAVDDLKNTDDDRGAGHVGEQEFAAGLFYLYLCVNRDLLKKNLQGDETLTKAALAALTEAVATVAPRGKQNSFASRAYASYIVAERGSRQPRSLAVAFLRPVSEQDYLAASIKALRRARKAMDRAYGPCADRRKTMDVVQGRGTLAEVLDFVSAD